MSDAAPASAFVHLHNHSEYSLLDGHSRIEDLVATAQKMGMPAVALTDHGNMFGAIELYLACRKASESAAEKGLAPIKPIIGLEAYIVPDGKKRSDRVLVDGEFGRHLLLLAENRTGYQNLMKLSTAAFLEGFYYRPRIDKDLLAAHSEGLIATSTDIGGEVPQMILRGDHKQARRLAGLYQEIIGRENYYFEIQDHGIPEEATINPEILKLAAEFGRPVVATNDVHYTAKSDARAHDVLLCIQTGKRLDDEKRLRFPNDEFYLKSPAEMAELFASLCPEAIGNTVELAERCTLEIPLNETHYPHFPIPEGRDPDEYFRELVDEGLHRRFGDPVPAEVKQRAEHELDVIIRLEFTGYLLIVWDLVRHARERGIPVGPGRGSAAGSLVCYALSITDINPFDYDLIFERFINEGRIEMPDIDIDFCQARREEMIEYVVERYGRENVAQIITFGTMGAKAAIRDVGRVMDMPLDEVDRIAKAIPTGPGQTLKKNLDENPDFQTLYAGSPQYKELVDVAMRIEGLVRQPGKHAAGVVIADKPLVEYCPLYRAPGEEAVSTQYHMKLLDAVGLLKVDFLGLQTLTVIHTAAQLIAKRQGVRLEMDKLALDDAATYAMLSRGESKGVFQFESDGMVRLLKQARPDRFEDLIALNAMYRPGPMAYISTFVSRKHGRERVTYLHPLLKPILAPTYGIVVYQEQVMRIANVLAGFSLSEADSLRKAMGKKIRALMDKYRVRFEDGCAQNGIRRNLAVEIYDLIEKFAEYGFNKSHSAAYARVAYQTAYLKANYPTEFMCALLTLDMGNTDKVGEYIEEAGRINVKVEPPDVNHSGVGFTAVSDGVIRYALAAIKGVGTRAMEALVEARQAHGPFGSLLELCERIDSRLINRSTIESLIKAGALDSIDTRRSQLVAVAEEALAVGGARTRDRLRGQSTMFDMFAEGAPDADSAGPLALPDVPEWDRAQLLEHEKSVLGFYLTHHPLDPHRRLVEQLSSATCGEVAALAEGTPVSLGVMIGAVRRVRTRKGEPMAVLQLAGFGSASCEAVVFPKAMHRLESAIVLDALVVVQGNVREGRQGKNVAVENIVPLETARQELVDRVIVKLNDADGAARQTLDALCQVAAAHPGPAGLHLHLELADGSVVAIEAGSELRVNPAAFEDEACRLVGDERVRLAPKPLKRSKRRTRDGRSYRPRARETTPF